MAGVRSKPQANGKYQGYFLDHIGRRKFFVGTRKKAETLRMAERLEDESRQVRLGYRPLRTSSAARCNRPFDEVAGEYLAWGKAQGGRGGRPWGKTDAKERERKLAWWQERLGLEILADLQGVLPRVEEALRELQEEGRPDVHRRHQRDGLTGKTLSSYAETLKTFCSWCVERGYLESNPLARMRPFDTTPKTKYPGS